jgi:hypothetical protein
MYNLLFGKVYVSVDPNDGNVVVEVARVELFVRKNVARIVLYVRVELGVVVHVPLADANSETRNKMFWSLWRKKASWYFPCIFRLSTAGGSDAFMENAKGIALTLALLLQLPLSIVCQRREKVWWKLAHN